MTAAATRAGVAALTLLCAGCAGAPKSYDPSQLNPEQLNALSKDKAGIVSCSTVEYLMSRVTTVFINADMGRLDGTVRVGPDCSSTMAITRPK